MLLGCYVCLFLNVILEQNNKAIKARNVCIANHHILSLHPQMQCQPLAWKLIWGSFQAWTHLRWRPSGKLSSSLTNQNLKFYLTVKDAEEKQSLVISLQFKVYIMIVWGGGVFMHIEWVTCKCSKAPLMLHGCPSRWCVFQGWHCVFETFWISARPYKTFCLYSNMHGSSLKEFEF